MTDKQIIIDDQKKTIHRLQDECTEKTNAIIALGEQLKRKEQECEELKKQRQGDKGLITSTGKMNYQLIQEYDKLKTALTEIKEIAEKQIEWNIANLNSAGRSQTLAKKILQKISECEGNDG